MLYFAGKGEERFQKEWTELKWGKVEFLEFPNKEQRVRLLSPVKDELCVVVQGMAYEPDKDWVRAMLLADALRENGARGVKLIAPFLSYALMNRHFEGEPISVRVVAKTLSQFFDEVEVWEVHEEGIAEFFEVPFYNRSILWEMAGMIATSPKAPARGPWRDDQSQSASAGFLTERRVASDQAGVSLNREKFSVKRSVTLKIGEKEMKSLDVVVAPDKGSVVRARQVAREWGVDLVLGSKERNLVSTEIKSLKVNGNVKGKRVVIVDDLVNTGGTIVRTAELLRSQGAKEIGLMVAHWLPVEGNWERVSQVVDWVITSNSVVNKLDKEREKLKIISIKSHLKES